MAVVWYNNPINPGGISWQMVMQPAGLHYNAKKIHDGGTIENNG